MTIWLIIIGIQMMLLLAWYRAAKFWVLLNKAKMFLRKSRLYLMQHKFEDEAKIITEDQIPKYEEWKVNNFIMIALVWIIFTLLPIVGLSMMETGDTSAVLNVIIAVLLAVIGYSTSLIRFRVDTLNIECDYIDNLVNIVKGNETSLENDN